LFWVLWVDDFQLPSWGLPPPGSPLPPWQRVPLKHPASPLLERWHWAQSLGLFWVLWVDDFQLPSWGLAAPLWQRVPLKHPAVPDLERWHWAHWSA
jgi:hypothetical protein